MMRYFFFLFACLLLFVAPQAGAADFYVDPLLGSPSGDGSADDPWQTLEGVVAAAGCRLELDMREGYPAVVNDPSAVASVRTAARRVFGEDNVHEPAPMAAAEDFSYFLNRVPGAFVLVGAGNVEREITAPHHSPRFDIDESVLPRGAELLARLALLE